MRKVLHFFWITLSLVLQLNSIAQTGISTANISSGISVTSGNMNYSLTAHSSAVNGVIPNQNYNLNYNNSGNRRVVDFTLSGRNFVNYTTFDTVIIRRASNAWTTTNGNKQHIYCDGPATLDNVTYLVNFPVAYPLCSNQNFMEKVIKQGYINRGSDNVFNNDASSDLTFNNIERIDFVYKNGLMSSDISKAGFLIAERGGNDPFKIAAITAIDLNGNPTAFGTVKSVAASAYGNAILNINSYVMRKEIGDTEIRLFSKVPAQDVKSVFLTFGDLSVGSLQKIYGYALMGNDVTAVNGTDVVDFTNTAYFPRNTNNANGGLDLSSAPGAFHTNLILDNKNFNLSLKKVNCTVQLEWQDFNQISVKEYQVEKATSSLQFEKIAIVSSQNIRSVYTDLSVQTSCFYRIKVIEQNGSFYYSEILNFNNPCNNIALTIYPNPVQEELHIVTGSNNKISAVNLISASGTEVGKWNFQQPIQRLDLKIAGIAAGTYFIRITNEHGQVSQDKIIKK